MKMALMLIRSCKPPARAFGRIVAQIPVAKIEIRDIEAKSVDAAIKPELRDVENRRAHRRIVKVEIRLLGEKIVHVVLAPPCVP